MEIFAEQFIGSDKSYKHSQIIKNISIGLFIASLLIIIFSLIIGIALILLSFTLFLISINIYIDYEYEFFDGTLSVTKIFSMSRRKTVLKMNKQSVKNIERSNANDVMNKRIKKFYTNNIDNLKQYNFELNNGNIVQLALNDELSKLIKIYFK